MSKLRLVSGRSPITRAFRAAAWPLAARAQQPDRMRRIGVLETVSVTLNAANYDALRQGLRELGYVEGRNLVIEYRSADGRAGRFPELATELIRRDVDLIITRGTPAALAAKNVTATIPVVMAASGDPVGTHLVASSRASWRQPHGAELNRQRFVRQAGRAAQRDGASGCGDCGFPQSEQPCHPAGMERDRDGHAIARVAIPAL